MAAAATAPVIDSELKRLKPPTAYASTLCDQANMKTFFKVFHAAKSGKCDAHVERVAHLILLSSRLHNAAVEGAVLPLVKQLSSGGGTMAGEMAKGMQEVEAAAAEIDKTKKHVSNKEFGRLMEEFEASVEEGFALEREALVALSKEMSEETLIDAAERMEQAKISATLHPGHMASA